MNPPITDPTISRHAGLAGCSPAGDDSGPTMYSPAVGDNRPTMSRKDLSREKAHAGIRAAAVAGESAEDPRAMKALMDAASGPLKIAGMEMKPVTLGTLKALRAIGSAFVADESVGLSEDDICLGILAFADSRRCWQLHRDGQIDVLRKEAEELTFEVSAADVKAAALWINGQLATLNMLSGDGQDHRQPPAAGEVGKPEGSCD